jgi:hypothetical protein
MQDEVRELIPEAPSQRASPPPMRTSVCSAVFLTVVCARIPVNPIPEFAKVH